MISLHPVELEKALDMVGFYDAEIEVVVDGKSIKSAARMFNSIRSAIVRFMSIS